MAKETIEEQNTLNGRAWARPEILLCRTLLPGECEEWPEGPLSQLIFQADFLLLQKSLEQPSQWSFPCQVTDRHVWLDSSRREQWCVKSPVRECNLKESESLEAVLDTDR